MQRTNLYKVHKIAAWHQFWESNNIKPFHKEKEKDNKLIETGIKLDLWAFVEVTRANETSNVFTVLSKADTKVDALVSASFGFVLRSPNGSEQSHWAKPKPLSVLQGGTKI